VRLNALALRAFDLVFTPYRRRRLADIRIAGLPRGLAPGAPIILIANHVSWWDGFLLREVHRRLRPRARLTNVMLAGELSRRPLLRALGAEPVQPGSTASLRALMRRLDELRSGDPEFVLVYFPQGRIWPADRRPLGFRTGIERIVRRLAPATILPVALRIEPLNTVSPVGFISVGQQIAVAGRDALVEPGGTGQAPADFRGPLPERTLRERITAAVLEAAVTTELDRIGAFLGATGEDAAAAWPRDPFSRLPDSAEARPLRSMATVQ
jgi:hypothetical protein